MSEFEDEDESRLCGKVRRGSLCTPNKFFFVWLGTWLFDWAWMLAVFPVLNWWFNQQEFTDPWGFVQIWILVWGLTVFLIARDEACMLFLGDLVSEGKTDDGVERSLYSWTMGPVKLTTWFTIVVFLLGPSSPIPLTRGLLDWHYDVMSLEGAAWMWFQWLVFYSWKDFFAFNIVHRMTHENYFGMYEHHKEHHQGKKNLNVFNAMTIGFIDNCFESGAIALMNVPIMWLLGWQLKMHMGSMVLTAVADVQVHSTNPYTVCWYNPFMDWIFLGTVQHNLHHAKGMGHYTVCPWHHIVPSWRSADIDDYNRIMYTDWVF